MAQLCTRSICCVVGQTSLVNFCIISGSRSIISIYTQMIHIHIYIHNTRIVKWTANIYEHKLTFGAQNKYLSLANHLTPILKMYSKFVQPNWTLLSHILKWSRIWLVTDIILSSKYLITRCMQVKLWQIYCYCHEYNNIMLI